MSSQLDWQFRCQRNEITTVDKMASCIRAQLKKYGAGKPHTVTFFLRDPYSKKIQIVEEYFWDW